MPYEQTPLMPNADRLVDARLMHETLIAHSLIVLVVELLVDLGTFSLVALRNLDPPGDWDVVGWLRSPNGALTGLVAADVLGYAVITAILSWTVEAVWAQVVELLILAGVSCVPAIAAFRHHRDIHSCVLACAKIVLILEFAAYLTFYTAAHGLSWSAPFAAGPWQETTPTDYARVTQRALWLQLTVYGAACFYTSALYDRDAGGAPAFIVVFLLQPLCSAFVLLSLPVQQSAPLRHTMWFYVVFLGALLAAALANWADWGPSHALYRRVVFALAFWDAVFMLAMIAYETS